MPHTPPNHADNQAEGHDSPAIHRDGLATEFIDDAARCPLGDHNPGELNGIS